MRFRVDSVNGYKTVVYDESVLLYFTNTNSFPPIPLSSEGDGDYAKLHIYNYGEQKELT